MSAKFPAKVSKCINNYLIALKAPRSDDVRSFISNGKSFEILPRDVSACFCEQTGMNGALLVGSVLPVII